MFVYWLLGHRWHRHPTFEVRLGDLDRKASTPRGTGSQGTSSFGTASHGTGSHGTQGTASQGTGSHGTASHGTASQGTASQGTGSHGTGSHGNGTGSNSLFPGSLAESVRLCSPFLHPERIKDIVDTDTLAWHIDFFSRSLKASFLQTRYTYTIIYACVCIKTYIHSIICICHVYT